MTLFVANSHVPSPHRAWEFIWKDRFVFLHDLSFYAFVVNELTSTSSGMRAFASSLDMLFFSDQYLRLLLEDAPSSEDSSADDVAVHRERHQQLLNGDAGDSVSDEEWNKARMVGRVEAWVCDDVMTDSIFGHLKEYLSRSYLYSAISQLSVAVTMSDAAQLKSIAQSLVLSLSCMALFDFTSIHFLLTLFIHRRRTESRG